LTLQANTGNARSRIGVGHRQAHPRPRWAPGGRHRSPPPTDGCVRPSPGVYGCLWGSCAEVRGSTGLHGQRRRAPGSEALLAVWQVQDSNLRRHTPTDLQNDAAHAVTCAFTTPPPNFHTISAQPAITRTTRDRDLHQSMAWTPRGRPTGTSARRVPSSAASFRKTRLRGNELAMPVMPGHRGSRPPSRSPRGPEGCVGALARGSEGSPGSHVLSTEGRTKARLAPHMYVRLHDGSHEHAKCPPSTATDHRSLRLR
jgi:hypothetical protein